MFGDQSRNAHMLSKHGGGIVLNKDDLEKPQRLRDALNSIFSDARYITTFIGIECKERIATKSGAQNNEISRFFQLKTVMHNRAFKL